MASSTIGWLELAYTQVPMALDGSDLNVQQLSWAKPAGIGPSYLVSGVATDSDMMRGEEVEAIGLFNSVDLPGDFLLVLPGTHSKHLWVENKKVRDIRTYMTGELYEVLSRQSVLSASVVADAPFDDSHFLEGVAVARELGLNAGLFKTRSRQVLNSVAPVANASFLSGLLIGSELRDAVVRSPGLPIIVAGSANLRSHYAAALRATGGVHWKLVSDDDALMAVPRGHQQILNHLQK